MLSVTFCGAARTVTGSQYYLQYTDPDGGKFTFCLDSGMFQVGQKLNLYKINSHLLFDPKDLDCIVLTHAHLDHCGRIPYLIRKGFGGKIYATEATMKIAGIVMEDAARHHGEGSITPDIGDILGQDNAEYDGSADSFSRDVANTIPSKDGVKKYMLYDDEDVMQAMMRFKIYDYHKPFKIHPNLEVEFYDAGHILGSAFVCIKEISSGKKVMFSGDLGNDDKPIIENPEMPRGIENVTHIFTETTYGNRQHGELNPKEKLFKVAHETLYKKKGKLLIPSFSVERAQEVIYFLVELMREGRLPQIPIYLDSPMASKVLQVCLDHPELYDHKLQKKIIEKANPLIYKNLKIIETADESKKLNKRNKPMIIVAGSGMLNGGRIIKHIQYAIEDPKNTLLFVGYQAVGTLGREIYDGAPQVEVEGRMFDVKIQKESINEFSAHADSLLLKKWIVSIVTSAKHKEVPTLFLMHGERDASLALGKEVESALQDRIKTYWPRFGETVTMWE